MKPRQPGLVHSGNLHCGRYAAFAGDSKSLDAARTELRQGGYRVFNSEIDLACYQILHNRGKPAIGHLLMPRLALNQAIKLFRSSAGMDFLAPKSDAMFESIPTGSKAFCTSYANQHTAPYAPYDF